MKFIRGRHFEFQINLAYLIVLPCYRPQDLYFMHQPKHPVLTGLQLKSTCDLHYVTIFKQIISRYPIEQTKHNLKSITHFVSENNVNEQAVLTLSPAHLHIAGNVIVKFA